MPDGEFEAEELGLYIRLYDTAWDSDSCRERRTCERGSCVTTKNKAVGVWFDVCYTEALSYHTRRAKQHCLICSGPGTVSHCAETAFTFDVVVVSQLQPFAHKTPVVGLRNA